MFLDWARRLGFPTRRRRSVPVEHLRGKPHAAERLPALRVSGAMLSHVGRVRSFNEDCVVFVAPGERTPEMEIGFLALVADGMGGHAAGEVASALAAETIRRGVYARRASPSQALREAFAAANDAILAHSAANPETRGMGTTCTAFLVQKALLWLAHVGDSRAYIMRGCRLHQLSEDQTLHARLIRDGSLTVEEAAVTPGGNILLQALGASERVTPQLWSHGLALRAGDRLLLCSDGLYAHLDDAAIAAALRTGREPEEPCRTLIEGALADGGSDNVSVGVFFVGEAVSNPKSEQTATKPIQVGS
jgi:protein phosphatase